MGFWEGLRNGIGVGRKCIRRVREGMLGRIREKWEKGRLRGVVRGRRWNMYLMWGGLGGWSMGCGFLVLVLCVMM